MTTETNRLKAKLDTLCESLDGIEDALEPLLGAQTFPETIVGLETMQQAKLQVVLPYLVYDLVFSA
jgi:exosome complex protein LRP1